MARQRPSRNFGCGARNEKDDVLVCLNPDTALHDIEEMGPNTAIFYNADLIQISEALKQPGQAYYGIPIEKLSAQVDAKLRRR